MSAVPSCSLSAATRGLRQALAYPDTFCAPSAPVGARREGSAVANQIEGPDYSCTYQTSRSMRRPGTAAGLTGMSQGSADSAESRIRRHEFCAKISCRDQTARSMRNFFSWIFDFSWPTGRQGSSFRQNFFPGPLTPAVTTWRSPNVAGRDGPRGMKEASQRNFSDLGRQPEPSTAGSSPILHLWPAAPCSGPSSSSSTRRIGS